MEFIRLREDNIDKEHICCSLTSKKGESGIDNKKSWLKDRFKDNLVFYKLNVRGKVFIEYIDSEKAWYPIEGENGIHINCLWVGGKYKENGYGSRLLDYCIEDGISRGKDYISVISSDKKRPFLSEPNFLKYKGFKIVDETDPYYKLYVLELNKSPNLPKFINNKPMDKAGFVLYYTSQCPFATDYANMIREAGETLGYPVKLIHLDSQEKAKKSPAIFSTYSLYKDGRFITNEILSESKFKKILEKGFI